MDITDPNRGSALHKKRIHFAEFLKSFNLAFPLLFLRDLLSYIIAKLVQLYRFSSAFGTVIATIITRLKNFVVSKLFWGRGNFYKVVFRISLVSLFFVWIYTAYWGGVGYVGLVQADSTYVLQQKDFDVEMGSSAPPIDEDRPRDSVREYFVQGGDTLSSIAQKFDISISTIKWANGLSSDYIKPGQKLKILPVTGVLHEVKSGDTLSSVAKKYNASEQAIADVNWIDPPFNLTAGEELMVPGGEIKSAPAPAPTPVVATVPTASTGGGAPVSASGQFVMPTTGYISQYYHTWHRAVDVASRGAPNIVASDGGRIIYSGWDSSGYGLTILIDHGNGYVTRYAHASSLYVKTGDYVSRGQAIMRMGSTGRSTGTHLHFEIIKNGIKQNPLAYL